MKLVGINIRVIASAAMVVGLLCALLTADARAQCTNTPFPAAGVGPVNPANGYPRYYVDASGLALGPCFDLAGNCPTTAADLPNPLAPLSFPGNFFDEWFYWLANAKMTLPNGGLGTLVMAVEGSFLNGAVVPGDQMVFSRLRVRVSGLVPNATYTVTHPYGVDSLVADGLGVINEPADSLALGALGFSGGPTAPASRVGPRFLVWDATLPAPPAGFVGFPALDHTVTGSPCGTNFFRVVGPGLPAGGVSTNLFSIAGRIQDVCGNGILDVSEQCDDGNRVAGDCCAPDCTFEPLNAPCTAPSICSNNACNGAGVCGTLSLNNGITCTDGNACTVGDTCTAGVCLGGPRSCDDLNVCTTDLCTPPTVGCENLNNAATCTDGNATTANDSCSGGACLGSIRRAILTRNAGEDPSLAGFPSVGDARTDGTRTRVSLTNMDPARFPVGCAGAAIRVGGISGTGTLTTFAAQAVPLRRASALHFLVNGNPAAGSAVDLRISCTVGGVLHQTRWAGTLANTPPPACVPTTCAAQGKNCGTIPDGCGGTLTCGVCTAPQVCTANVCAACVPTTCAAQGKNCGTIPDGCGGTLTCGVCTAPQTCGGGGVANVCGVCTPTTCAAQGKNCGTIPDACGGTLTCGVCTAPQTCGGAGVANVCGAAPATATLTLTATGRGGERVTSTPAGLNVATGTTATATFTIGTSITLQATNARDVIWSGVCSSNGAKVKTCTFTLNANASETANVQ